MKNLNKLLIVLISMVFISTWVFAQQDVSPKLNDQNQMGTKVKPSEMNAAQQIPGSDLSGLAPTTTQLIEQRLLTEGPVMEKPYNFGPTDDLCIPNYSTGCTWGDGFFDFAVEEIQNFGSGCANLNGTGYSQYYGLGPANLVPGFTHIFQMSVGYSSQHVNIWIDFNNDDILSGDEMILYDYVVANTGTLYDVPVTIPANATPGLHKMRAMCVWITTFTDPCGSYTYGEAEDYTVNIVTPEYGTLQGTVTANTGGAPIQGALVSVQNGMFTATTAANGTYTINNVLVGTWPVSCTKVGYNPNSSTVTITNGGTTTKNFAMTAPIMNLSPSSITVTIDPYAQQTEVITISNTGDGPLAWNASIINNTGDELLTDMGYGYNAYDPSGMLPVGSLTFMLNNPAVLTPLGPAASNFVATADWVNDVWYGVIYGGTLITIDMTTGAITTIGSCPDFAGMEYDWTTNTMYGVTFNGDLYTMDLTTGAGTYIGTGAPGMITMVCDNTGTLYGFDLNTDYFGMIDKNTGAWTPIGYVGFDFIYAEDASTDHETNTIYWAAYVPGMGGGNLFTIDQATGATTFIGMFAGGAEITGFAIPGAPSTWIGISPNNGNVAAGGSGTLDVNLDATDIIPGTILEADVHFVSNPNVGTQDVHVTMIVGALQVGHITGTVSLTGAAPYNNGDVTQVLVQAGPYWAYPNASGNYDITAYPGTYNVTATLYGYATQTQNNVVVPEAGNVTVNYNMPTIQGAVAGVVTAQNGGAPIAGATVKLVGTDFETTTAGDGSYMIVVEPGTYNVKVTVPFYASQTASVVINTLSTTTQNFVLADLEGIWVVIDLDPTPNAGLVPVLEGFFPGGLVEYTTSITGYPLDEQVQTVFLMLGIFANNHVLTQTEATVITTWLDTYGGNLYMEGGDTWAYDTPTTLHGYFHLNGVADGGADLFNVDGIDSFWTGFNWSYSGENNWIDQLEAISPAINVMQNPTAGYYTGVAYNSGTYRTVGASHEITGLNDGTTGYSMAVAAVLGYFGYPVFAYGDLEGYVTQAGSGSPIQGATVSVGGLGSATSAANGYYLIEDILVGNWTATCEKAGYNTVTAPVVILEDQTTVQNFTMTQPAFNVSPLSINETLEPNEITTVNVTISNPGTGSVAWNAAIAVQGDQTKDPWDLQFTFDVTAASGAAGNAGAECDGQYYYSTRWASNLIHKYDLNGVLVEEFSIPGVTGLRDLAYDGTYFYGGAAANTVYKMDFVNKTLVTSFSSPQPVRNIAYDHTVDGLWVGNWATDIALISMSGTTITTLPATVHNLAGMYGTAFDNVSDGTHYLWIFDQGSGAGTPQYIHQANVTAMTMTGFSYDVLQDIGPDASAIAGGLFLVDNVYPGSWSIGGLKQGVPDAIFMYELAAAQNWISIAPTSGNLPAGGNQTMVVTLDATGLLPGQYEADINFSTTPNVGSPTIDVTLTVAGLIPAINLTGTYSCTDVDLTWDIMTGGTPDSYNVYRDGTLLGNVTVMEYTDEMVMPGVQYSYTVKAVYGGVEAQPTPPFTITVPTPGSLQPLGLQVEGIGSDAHLSWNEPNACLDPDEYKVYRDGNYIATTTELEYVDENLPSGFYEYYVKAVYYFGESGNSTPAYVLIVGIENPNAMGFEIYPNPASDVVHVKSDYLVTSYEILDNAGQVVLTKDVNDRNFQVNVGQFERGIYYIKLQTSEGVTLRKLAVK